MRILLLASLTFILSACQHSIRREFQGIYDRRAALALRHAVDPQLAEMTPDYVVALRNGDTMKRDDLRARWTFYYDSVVIRHLGFANVLRDVERKGDTAIVTVEQKDHRIQKGPGGKPMDVEADVVHKDTWVLTPNGWKLRRTDEGEQTKFEIDGKAQPIN